jgi:hypothetical protein
MFILSLFISPYLSNKKRQLKIPACPSKWARTESCVFPEGRPTAVIWHNPYLTNHVVVFRRAVGRSIKLLLALTSTVIFDSESSSCFLHTGDLFGGPGLIILNHALTCRWKRNLTNNILWVSVDINVLQMLYIWILCLISLHFSSRAKSTE